MLNLIIKASWVPYTFRLVSERPDAAKIIAKDSLHYVLFMMIAGLAGSLFSEDIIRTIGKADYYAAIPLIPLFMLAYFINSVGTAMGRGMDLSKKTRLGVIPSWLGSIVVVATAPILLERFGAAGGVYMVILGFLTRVICQVTIAHWLYPRPFYGVRLGWIVAMGLIGYTASRSIPAQPLILVITLKGLLLIGVSIVAFVGSMGTSGALELPTLIRRRLAEMRQ
jgi:O-antigen/teichoic acid export membrane protein